MSFLLALFAMLGGIFGVLIRFLIIQYNNICLLYFSFPFLTLIVNILGSLISGLLFPKLNCNSNLFSFFIVGLCGGMTTMSTCALESYLFIEKGNIAFGITNTIVNVGLSVFFVFVGFKFSKIIF
jgi:fluoride exporter